MKRMIMGCAVAAMVALSARSEARPSYPLAFTRSTAPDSTQVERKVGVASWYGDDFDGNTTASGEVFDMNGLTAASRDLPLGTKIQIKNLKNNRSIVLRVNDRGPYIPGRFLDVSKTAAERLGFLNTGLAHVEMRVVRFPSWYVRGNPGSN